MREDAAQPDVRTSGPMPNKYEDPFRPTLRPGKGRYQRALKALASMGVDMNAAFRAWLDWINHDTDELPPRPPKPAPKDTEE